jgi:hypothetical protein
MAATSDDSRLLQRRRKGLLPLVAATGSSYKGILIQ